MHLYKCFVGMWRRSGRVSSAWWHVRTALRFALGKDLCMVPCHSCHIYLWDLDKQEQKGVGACLTFKNWGCQCKSQNGGSFQRESRFSLCNTAVLWNFIASLTGNILEKIILDTSLYYCCFIWLRLAKPKVQLKVS